MRLRLSALVAVVALSCGCAPLRQGADYTPRTMTVIPTERTTHCIGRYLVTLPSNFEPHGGGWGSVDLYYGLNGELGRVHATVQKGRFTGDEFRHEVGKRRLALSHAKNAATRRPMLLHAEQLDGGGVLLRRFSDEVSAESIRSEVHVLVGQRYVLLEQKSHDDAAGDAGRPMHYGRVDPTPAERRLKMIAARLVPYDSAQPASPGFCMQGVLFDAGQEDERASFDFSARGMGDAVLEVDYHAVTGQPNRGILERHRRLRARYPAARARVAMLREGKSQLGGGGAEEVLARTSRTPFQHHFDIERRDEAPRSLDNPFFSIALKTGMRHYVPVPAGQKPPKPEGGAYYSRRGNMIVHPEGDASLSDQQAIGLWDQIVSSVRRR